MSINAADAFNQALELFSSLYLDMEPTDLPAGLSPDNQDVWYLPGKVGTRPAVNATIIPFEPGSDTVSITEYATPSGDILDIWLSSLGTLVQQDNSTGALTKIGSVTAGSQFKSVSAFQKQWFAFYNQALSAAFTESPFCGMDIPRYYDGKNLWRVTQDGPGLSPLFNNIATLPIPLLQSVPTGSLSITAVVSSGAVTYSSDEGPITIYHSLTYTCAAPVSATFIGTQTAITGCTGTNASLANRSGTILSVSGSTFTIRFYSAVFVNLSAQTGTGAIAGNYFTRSGNMVTAYTNGAPTNLFAGLYAQVVNSNGTQINGPNWTIDATGGIARDATGLVTITIDTQLTNLTSGSVLYINAADTTDFPVGFQTVYQILSATGGKTTFTVSNPTWGNGAVVISNAGGSVYQQWSGVFQVLSVGVDLNGNNFFTYFQLGPDANLSSAGGTPQAQVQAQVAPGPRSAVVIFESVNGAQTSASIPVQLSLAGGTNLFSAQQVPLGPAGTAKRIIALTPAYGSSYSYISPALIPSAGGLSPVLSLGTIINDNTSTSAILDFSDAQLTAGTPIDIQGNNLFNQIVLAPCLGCIEYEGRMDWYGELNNIKNIVNCGFQGGYQAISGVCSTSGTTVNWVSGSQFPGTVNQGIIINGVLYQEASWVSGTQINLTTSAGVQTNVPFTVIQAQGAPLGWSQAGATGTNGTLVDYTLDSALAQGDGFAYQIAGATTSNAGMISQAGWQDYYGAPILSPLTSYIFMVRIHRSGATNSGNLICDLYSPSVGTLAIAQVALAPLSTTLNWAVALFNQALPAVIPSDTMIRIYQTGGGSVTSCTFQDVLLIDANQPVLFQQIRLSYFGNPFGYDDITGLLGFDGSAKITGAFKQRGYLNALTDGPMYQTQNNGSTEPNGWSFPQFADSCDCFGPNAVDTTEDIAWWAGNAGLQLFLGQSPKKISQEIQPLWATINPNAPTSAFICDDPIQRVLYIGVPTGTNTKPTLLPPMSYRSVDAVYNVPDPLHTSYSGKLIATDLCRKWTRWNLPMSCAAMLTQPGLQKQVFFGGRGHGNFYSLNFSKYTDDDYGQIVSYYVTYFFFNHDIEQNTPGLGLHQKLFTYLTAYITGVGQVQPTIFVNTMGNTWQTFATVWDPINNVWATSGAASNPLQSLTLKDGTVTIQLNDQEWGLNVKNATRIAVKWTVTPLPGQTDAAFQLTHMVLSCRDDRVAAVRGANQ